MITLGIYRAYRDCAELMKTYSKQGMSPRNYGMRIQRKKTKRKKGGKKR